MAKLSTNHIVEADILEYVQDYSDFSFELKVLSLLTAAKFQCEHGGIYEDPITKKSREFDIRATRMWGRLRARLAVECKNIRPNFPLVIHGMKRVPHESYYDILIRRIRESRSHLFKAYDESPDPGDVVREQPALGLYSTSEVVGKHPDQVGRHAVEKTILTGDGAVYEKISQSIHSAYDLIHAALFEPDEGFDKASFILPILVVPDSSIWLVPYDNDGTRTNPPRNVDRISLYIGKTWQVGKVTNYTISHLEIVQISSLIMWLAKLFDDDVNWDWVFHSHLYNLRSVNR